MVAQAGTVRQAEIDCSSMLIIADHFVAVACPQRAPGGRVDRVANESHRPVAQQHIHALFVETSCGLPCGIAVLHTVELIRVRRQNMIVQRAVVGTVGPQRSAISNKRRA